MGLFTRYRKKNFDLSYILSKGKHTEWEQLWMILPMEICEIIFKHWITLHLEYAKKFLSSLSDADLYSELRKRNQFCFNPTQHRHIELYVKSMEEIGLLDAAGFENNLIYSKSEIESGSEIVNMSVKNNIYYSDLIIRTDYYTISDLYDSINTIVGLHSSNPDADEYDNKIIDFWINQSVKKRLQYCINIFPKVKDQFFSIEPMTTNGSRFNSLKQSCYEIMRNLFISEDLMSDMEDNTDSNTVTEQENPIGDFTN